MADDIDGFHDATHCPECGRESCEDHVPVPAMPVPDRAAYEVRLTAAIESERMRREARRIVDLELHPPPAIPIGLSLRERLARVVPTPEWRIRAWQPHQSRVLVSAQYKSGKTVLVDNWIRSMVDGDPFLGRDVVTPITGSLIAIDVEMPERKREAWLRRQVIRDDDRVVLYCLRNAAGSFNVLDDGIRQQWVERIRAHRGEALVLDCARPVFDALGLDEQREAGRFLVAFDRLLADAGIEEALVVHHMGHTNERARGDSRLRDWPDVEWRLMRKDETPSSARFIAAYGRDVEVEESALAFDALDQHLTIQGGSRADVRKREALGAICELLETEEPVSGRGIKDRLKDTPHARNTIDAALSLGVREHTLVLQEGPRKANLYRRAGGSSV